MKKKPLSARILSLVLLLSLLSGMLAIPVSAETAVLTQSQIQQIEKNFDRHGYVLKTGFWANSSASGKKAIQGVQKLLNMAGYDIAVDGGFGPETKNAVLKFQKAKKLTADGIVGNGTFDALVKAAESKLTVRDLKITAPARVTLKPGASSSFTVQFSGVGIDRITLSASGSGLNASFAGSSWKAYPGVCTASVKVTASSSFQSGSVTFSLVNNSSGAVKTQTISVGNGSAGFDAAAMIADAKKDLGKTGSQLGYHVDYCAYYVSDLLRANGCSVPRAANPRDLVIQVLNSGKGTYYSFRAENTESLLDNGLKSRSRVVQTSRGSVTPRAGDIVVYLWTSDVGSYLWSHTGIVTSYAGGTLKTIEGNTSNGSRSGVVAEKSRSYDATVVGILRIG